MTPRLTSIGKSKAKVHVEKRKTSCEKWSGSSRTRSAMGAWAADSKVVNTVRTGPGAHGVVVQAAGQARQVRLPPEEIRRAAA